MDYLIETSIIRALFGNDERVTIPLARVLEPDRFYASVITQGELLFGAERALGAKRTQLFSQISEFFKTVSAVLPVTEAVASVYAHIRGNLTERGQMIPVNDLWIAATAICGDLTLVAHDEHFRRVDGLRLEDWLEA